MGIAAAQVLTVPSEGRVGEPLVIQGEALVPGAYPVEVEGPGGLVVETVEALDGRFEWRYVPEAPGTYTVRLYHAPEPLERTVRVAAVQPALTPEGLRVGEVVLPLPEPGAWIGPVVANDRVYVARGLALIEVDPEAAGRVAVYYPPAEVEALEVAGGLEVVLRDGRRMTLEELLRPWPFAGEWRSLEGLAALRAHWAALGRGGTLPSSPTGAKPFWVYFAEDPEGLTPADLEAWGRDLLRRGHRVELPWGEEARPWFMAWVTQARQARDEGLEASRAWSDALLAYAPLFPGSVAFFQEQAAWFAVQGRPDLEVRYAEAVAALRAFAPPWTSEGWGRGVRVALVLYVALVALLWARYLGRQRQDLRPVGGWLGAWFRHPLLRVRHLLLAYATLGERLLMLVVFAGVVGVFVAYGLTVKIEQTLRAEALSRASLQSQGALSALRGLPVSPELEGILAYAEQSVSAGRALERLERAAPAGYALALRARLSGEAHYLAEAYRLAPGYVPVREALGLGGDYWSGVYRSAGVDRAGVPRWRDLWSALMLTEARFFLRRPFEAWVALPFWPAVGWAYLGLGFALAWVAYHLLGFVLPRPRGVTRSRGWGARLVHLLVPGSASLGSGWGFVLLAGFAYGLVTLVEGAFWAVYVLGAAYLLHLPAWFREGLERGAPSIHGEVEGVG